MLEQLLGTYVPDLGGALWLGLVVALLLFGDSSRIVGPRNLAILGLLASAPFLNDIGRWSYEKHPGIAPWWWTAIFLITAGHAVWGAALARRERTSWTPNVKRTLVATGAALLVLMNVLVALAKDPEDAGRYVNMGAQRWLETGILPYADPQLQGPTSPGFGAATTYGPLLYLSHVPPLLVLKRPYNPPDVVVRKGSYQRPPDLATKLVTIAFHLAGLAALFSVTRRLAGVEPGLGAVALYACMPYLAGLDAGNGSIAGVRFISHLAPSAVLLLALATTARPFLSGTLFAASAGTLFFPVFMFPAWLAWRIWRRDRPARFAAGVAVGGAAILALVVAFTPASSIWESIALFARSIIEHQEGTGPRQYGASTFGFWGTHPGLASFWHAPLVGSSPFANPVFLLLVIGCFAACWWTRRGGLVALAGVTAAIGAGIQLWKTHGGGTYIEWYLPFLILALIAGRDPSPEPAGAGAGASSAVKPA
jgi:hypothetical protein